MKKLLEKQAVFNQSLSTLHFFSKWKITTFLVIPITNLLARINLLLNKPKASGDLEDLAQTWRKLMPPDGQEYFKIKEIKDNTAITEIHLNCPLRGSGNTDMCHQFMNYDRQLMEKVGGSLTVLESQSEKGKSHCTLAIRRKEDDLSDLIPAHKRVNPISD